MTRITRQLLLTCCSSRSRGPFSLFLVKPPQTTHQHNNSARASTTPVFLISSPISSSFHTNLYHTTTTTTTNLSVDNNQVFVTTNNDGHKGNNKSRKNSKSRNVKKQPQSSSSSSTSTTTTTAPTDLKQADSSTQTMTKEERLISSLKKSARRHLFPHSIPINNNRSRQFHDRYKISHTPLDLNQFVEGIKCLDYLLKNTSYRNDAYFQQIVTELFSLFSDMIRANSHEIMSKVYEILYVFSVRHDLLNTDHMVRLFLNHIGYVHMANDSRAYQIIEQVLSLYYFPTAATNNKNKNNNKLNKSRGARSNSKNTPTVEMTTTTTSATTAASGDNVGGSDVNGECALQKQEQEQEQEQQDGEVKKRRDNSTTAASRNDGRNKQSKCSVIHLVYPVVLQLLEDKNSSLALALYDQMISMANRINEQQQQQQLAVSTTATTSTTTTVVTANTNTTVVNATPPPVPKEEKVLTLHMSLLLCQAILNRDRVFYDRLIADCVRGKYEFKLLDYEKRLEALITAQWFPLVIELFREMIKHRYRPKMVYMTWLLEQMRSNIKQYNQSDHTHHTLHQQQNHFKEYARCVEQAMDLIESLDYCSDANANAMQDGGDGARFYSAVLNVISEVYDVEYVSKWYQRAVTSGVKLDMRSVNAYVRSLCKWQKLDEALRFVRGLDDNSTNTANKHHHHRGLVPDAYTFSILISGCETSQQMRRVIHEMHKGRHIELTTVVGNTVLSNLCSRGRLEAAFSFYQRVMMGRMCEDEDNAVAEDDDNGGDSNSNNNTDGSEKRRTLVDMDTVMTLLRAIDARAERESHRSDAPSTTHASTAATAAALTSMANTLYTDCRMLGVQLSTEANHVLAQYSTLYHKERKARQH